MRTTAGRLRGAVAMTLLLAGAVPALAEVSTDRRADRVNTLIMSLATGTDDIDPIPQTQADWEPFRDLSPDRLLNPTGVIRPDGRPDIAYHPGNGYPAVVWAYNNGTDHDIVISVWNGLEWSAPEFLTSGPADEVDPRVSIGANGLVHVVWWIDGNSPEVRYAAHVPLTESLTVAVAVSPTGEQCRRPSVVVHNGVVRIAYERDSTTGGAGTDLVILKRDDLDESFTLERTYAGSTYERFEPVLHTKNGKLWIDWVHSDTEFAHAEFRPQLGSWGNAELTAWSDHTWVDIEMIRHAIQRQIMGGGPAATDPGPD